MNTHIMALWGYLSRQHKKQFLLIFILMIISSLAEIISVGAIFPFLGVLTAPEHIYSHSLMQPVIKILGITSSEQLFLPLVISFVISVVVAGVLRVFLLYVINRFEQLIGTEFSAHIYRRTLYQDYATHIGHNSSEIISSIISKVNIVIKGVIIPVLELLSSSLSLFGIMFILVFIDYKIALVSFGIFGAIYWILYSFLHKKIIINSQYISSGSTNTIKALQEGLGGIRDILIDSNQEFYCKLFIQADTPYRRAISDNNFISYAPRFVIETLGLVLISGLAYYLSQQKDGISVAIPMLGLLAMAAQRLMPAIQKIYSSVTSIKGSYYSVKDILYLLDQPISSYIDQQQLSIVPFKKDIKLDNVWFRYNKKTPWILKEVNLTFNKGSRIGFVGETGRGKSTLLDLVMGLLSPTKGHLKIDSKIVSMNNIRLWQSHIAHVPQNIYLSDGTIEENIAFGIPADKIDAESVKKVAELANISKFIDSCAQGYKTFVGERGVRLSGGQRQRIGIARALYKSADVLIFDEATNALDVETESAIMESIEKLGKNLTIFIITHRVATLKACDLIVELDKDCTINIKKYQDIVK
jgi:ATP-binding cassette, subfamily B, bacterial PglK